MCAVSSKFDYFNKKSCLKIIIIFAVASLIYYFYKTSLFYSATNFEYNLKSLEKSKYEKSIVSGLGDLGQAAVLSVTSAAEKLKIERGFNETGFNAWLSERIALRRSVADIRDERCRQLSYNEQKLPRASIIIVHHNEQVSVVLRALHSLFDRTPRHLLEEIILVNDNSENVEFTFKDFGSYLVENFGELVQQIKLENHEGLMRARVKGARRAKGEVLVFLDAHIEVAMEWLPPLLAPISVNNKTCTTPIIDTIKYDTFEYVAAEPSRGAFNWDFNYVQLPLLPDELKALPQPHTNPIMNGGLFAINAAWFWQLGAYDEALTFWGAEQYELSLKLWLCGGRLLEVPCSRVGHLFRHGNYRISYTNKNSEKHYVEKNYKRVIEVWLDDYKDIIYGHINALTLIRVGNLRKQKDLRKSLNCKPFKYFLEHVAPDLLAAYPLYEPSDYAQGGLESIAMPGFCLSTMQSNATKPVLQECSNELKYPIESQKWSLSFRRDLRQQGKCLEVRKWHRNAPVWIWPCHLKGGNQLWYYDRQTAMLVQGKADDERRCLEAHIESRRVFANDCDFGNPKQQWRFGYINNTALDAFWHGINYNNFT